MRQLRFYLCIAVLVLPLGCIGSNQYDVLETRVARIQQENSRQDAIDKTNADELETLKKQVEGFSKTTRENYAEVKSDIRQLKEQFYRIQGQLEELRHKFGLTDQVREESVEKRIDRLDTAISRNYEKLIALEKYMGFEPSEPGPSGESSTPQEVEQTEEGLYNYAKQLFDQGDRENARLQFENFISKYPESKNADNARYWIADSYYSEKWYEKAILEYQKVLEKYPDSNKNAAARLKQGYAFAELGEKANARLILNELIKRYPKSQEAKYAKKKLDTLK